ncbi:MAG TPA: type I-C CRISPR-associated protein Cas7/Csd2 [Clostridiaceae bacterium]|nr:type I-C CRISPR-associated protein Cas7/Csd2 [Clostridiaceae bacterium]
MLNKKIDFVVYFTVENANPNGDPLSGNMPRQDNELKGLVSDVCLKRKIRNRMQDEGHNIFVQANERIEDGFKSLEARFEDKFNKEDDNDSVYKTMCNDYLDVRSFGQVITFGQVMISGNKKAQKRSIGIRGPVSITMAKSINPVNVSSMQITRSTNGMKAEEGKQKSSDTMGMKHYVDFGLYCFSGSINPFFAEKTGFSEDDANVLKEILQSLFVNDASSARPDGSMEIVKVYWVEHPSKLGLLSSAKIRSLFSARLKDENLSGENIEDYSIEENLEEIEKLKNSGATIEIFEGQ